jgi:adenine deaminase
MSSDPADFFGIRDRGWLKPGQPADIVISRQAHGEALARHLVNGEVSALAVADRGIIMLD